MNNPDKFLSEIKRIVKSQEPSATVYLYGSRVKGTASPHSDWDILILLNKDKITPEMENSVTYPLYDLEFDTGEVISPMVYSDYEWHNKYHITSFYHNVMEAHKLL